MMKARRFSPPTDRNPLFRRYRCIYSLRLVRLTGYGENRTNSVNLISDFGIPRHTVCGNN
jgi:hypothetical protein